MGPIVGTMPRTNADSSLPPIGWIGLGEMGLPMSANLVAAGHTVFGFDLDPAKCAAAGEAGVQVVGSTAELVERGEILVSMLRTGIQTEELLLGEGGLAELAGGGPRDVVVMSTLDPPAMERLAEECAARGLTIFDVPVSGGVRGAGVAIDADERRGGVDGGGAAGGGAGRERTGGAGVHVGDDGRVKGGGADA